MKKIIPKLFIFVVAMQLIGTANAQTPASFTQYMNNLTPFNSAYSTIDKAANVNVVGQKQLIGFNGAPTTLWFNGSIPIELLNSAAGLIVLNDRIGIQNLTEVNAFFAKKIQLSATDFLSTSINAGFRSFKSTPSGLAPEDPSFNTSDVSTTVANIGLGVMLTGTNYYVGVSLPRLTLKSIGKSAQENNYEMNTYYLAAAYLKSLSSDFKIKPATLVSYSGTNLPVQANISTTLYIKDVLGVGANYRTDNSLAGILSLFINNNIQFGYSYQFATGQYAIGGINNSTQEITLSYRFGNGLKAKLL